MTHTQPFTLQTVDLARAPGTAIVWLNRPDKGNALDAQTISGLLHVLAELLADADVRVIVLAGRGDSFCSGLDLDGLTGEQTHALPAELEQAATLLALIRDANKPVIVRAHGHCAGIGMALAAAATITITARDARYAHPGVLLGVTPHLSAPTIAAAIGPRAARRWLLTGETMDAPEAWRLGLAHELCEADELDARINHILGYLINAAPSATRETLALLRMTDTLIPDPATQARSLAATLQGPDAQAGTTARRDEQVPPWVAEILEKMPEE